MDSSALKSVGLAWLRYGKRMPLVCTEVGRWSADILGLSASHVIEIETKISISDLRRDFTSKIAKHHLYANAQESSVNVPNFFYFLVPHALADQAVKIVEEQGCKAGVLSCTAHDPSPFAWKQVGVIKRAPKLRAAAPRHDLVETVMMRCSSELCGLHIWNNTFSKKVVDFMETGKEDVLRMVARSAGTLDIEEPTNDLELRARELAFCVDGLDSAGFHALPEDGKKKWMEASLRLLDAQYVNARGWTKSPLLT